MNDFVTNFARFSTDDAAYIADLLRGALAIVNSTLAENSEDTQVIEEFIEALEDCDTIEIYED